MGNSIEDWDEGSLGAAVQGLRSSLADIQADMATYRWPRRPLAHWLFARRLEAQIDRLERQICKERISVLREQWQQARDDNYRYLGLEP